MTTSQPTPRPIPFIPRTPADALAVEITRAFNDESRLSFYRQICAGHEHSVVYRAFRETMAIPADQVKRSRRALFLFILHSYDQDDHPRD